MQNSMQPAKNKTGDCIALSATIRDYINMTTTLIDDLSSIQAQWQKDLAGSPPPSADEQAQYNKMWREEKQMINDSVKICVTARDGFDRNCARLARDEASGVMAPPPC